MFKRALVSVSDKTGIDNFLRPFVESGMQIVSSGGTAQFLREKGFTVTDVSEQTGFPEVMGGRVKTLNPRVHMPILHRGAEDAEVMAQHELEPFDLVVVNLYPFAAAVEKGVKGDELVEFIDIGGPSLLRAAAKNHKYITVVTDPADYTKFETGSSPDITLRKQLAAKVFQLTASYDAVIADQLTETKESVITGDLVGTLRYGENPAQEGKWYAAHGLSGWQDAKLIQGKALSYNNLLDLDAAKKTLELYAEPTVISVKHNNPCGVASDASIFKALTQSVEADPVSVFGGIIASNKPIDEDCAKKLSTMFLECVVAPDYTAAALECFRKKKNLRILKWSQVAKSFPQTIFRSIAGGYLTQTYDVVDSYNENWVLHGTAPNEIEKQAINFCWNVVSALKSNAIAVTTHSQTLGLGMGQVNRVDAVEQALGRAQKFHPDVEPLVLASDAFFPFPDSIELAAKAGVKWIVQPGGSIKDEEVISMAKKLSINMVMTGKRHFRH